jgi:hypothetical protein
MYNEIKRETRIITKYLLIDKYIISFYAFFFSISENNLFTLLVRIKKK